jgi:hypothetical protein
MARNEFPVLNISSSSKMQKYLVLRSPLAGGAENGGGVLDTDEIGSLLSRSGAWAEGSPQRVDESSDERKTCLAELDFSPTTSRKTDSGGGDDRADGGVPRPPKGFENGVTGSERLVHGPALPFRQESVCDSSSERR